MYEQLVRIRMVEEAIVALYPQQEMRCPTHLSVGQEAPAVGISAHLATSDLVFGGHRSHAHYLAKGGNLKAMLAELYGKVTGCARGKGGSQHLIDTPCGFMGAAPGLIWVSGAMLAAAFIVLVPLALWIYTWIFAFGALWFAHYGLSALHELRRAAGADDGGTGGAGSVSVQTPSPGGDVIDV